jgi:hypothetical protein
MRSQHYFRSISLSVVSVVMLSAARMATAQCDGLKRPPTAAEAKAYADGFALFQRIAPQAPAGWTAIDAEMTRDETAQFTLIYGETDVAMSSAYKPMASAVGKGYRQDYRESNGNPHAELVVLLPPVTGVPGRTVVRISGDPARADALLKATQLR